MRFDDTIATVLATAETAAADPAGPWRQLIDLIAQRRHSARLADAYAFLEAHRGMVPPAIRSRTAAAYAGRRLPKRLVGFFAGDRMAVAAPLLASVELPAADWVALVPTLGPGARALLRHRRDLGREVELALAGFGQSDLIVAGPETDALASSERDIADAARTDQAPHAAAGSPPDDAATAGEAQIRELLDRIEAFRATRAPIAEGAVETPPEEAFSFETDHLGRIVWVDGVTRGPLIGQTIAIPAAAGDHGVDGQAAGAYRRRAPFRAARLSVAGESDAGGDWRISGVPFFDPARGRFEGYRCSARRPRRDEIAGEASGTRMFGAGIAPDSLRQLVHEIRTPLNAIQGFADMIDNQMLGPAAIDYRERASEIAAQAKDLVGMVEDLDLAARMESDRLGGAGGSADGAELLARLHAEYLPLAREHEVDLRFTLAERLPALAVPAPIAERMFARLLAATIGMAGKGETIAIGFDGDLVLPGSLRLAVTRPAALADLGTAELMDPGYSPDGDWPDAPALGLGFALRLVGNLAHAHRGRLSVLDDCFVLSLPGVGGHAAGNRHSG